MQYWGQHDQNSGHSPTAQILKWVTRYTKVNSGQHLEDNGKTKPTGVLHAGHLSTGNARHMWSNQRSTIHTELHCIKAAREGGVDQWQRVARQMAVVSYQFLQRIQDVLRYPQQRLPLHQMRQHGSAGRIHSLDKLAVISRGQQCRNIR